MKKTVWLTAVVLTGLGIILVSKMWLDPANFVRPQASVPSVESTARDYDNGTTYAGSCCGRPRPGVNEFPIFAIILFGLSGLAVFLLTLRTLQRHHSRQP